MGKQRKWQKHYRRQKKYPVLIVNPKSIQKNNLKQNIISINIIPPKKGDNLNQESNSKTKSNNYGLLQTSTQDSSNRSTNLNENSNPKSYPSNLAIYENFSIVDYSSKQMRNSNKKLTVPTNPTFSKTPEKRSKTQVKKPQGQNKKVTIGKEKTWKWNQPSYYKPKQKKQYQVCCDKSPEKPMIRISATIDWDLINRRKEMESKSYGYGQYGESTQAKLSDFKK